MSTITVQLPEALDVLCKAAEKEKLTVDNPNQH